MKLGFVICSNFLFNFSNLNVESSLNSLKMTNENLNKLCIDELDPMLNVVMRCKHDFLLNLQTFWSKLNSTKNWGRWKGESEKKELGVRGEVVWSLRGKRKGWSGAVRANHAS